MVSYHYTHSVRDASGRLGRTPHRWVHASEVGWHHGSAAVLEGHITSKEAAERLRYTIQHIRRLLRKGKLEGRKIGRDWMVAEDSVKQFASRQENLSLPLRVDLQLLPRKENT